MILPKRKSAETAEKISLSKSTGTNLVGTSLPLLVLAASEEEMPGVTAAIS
jgi:hypothetical protein